MVLTGVKLEDISIYVIHTKHFWGGGGCAASGKCKAHEGSDFKHAPDLMVRL